MRYVGAYLLLKQSSSDKVAVEDIQRVLESAGVEYDGKKAKSILEKLENQDIEKVTSIIYIYSLSP